MQLDDRLRPRADGRLAAPLSRGQEHNRRNDRPARRTLPHLGRPICVPPMRPLRIICSNKRAPRRRSARTCSPHAARCRTSMAALRCRRIPIRRFHRVRASSAPPATPPRDHPTDSPWLAPREGAGVIQSSTTCNAVVTISRAPGVLDGRSCAPRRLHVARAQRSRPSSSTR